MTKAPPGQLLAIGSELADFVLIHGAMHAGWYWQPVQEILVSEGHRVVAPNLAGSGPDRTPIDLVDLDMISRRVVDVAHAHGRGEPVVLVGHGWGGLVVAEVAQRAPSDVLGAIFVAGALVPPGHCFLQALGVDVERKLPYVSRGTDFMRLDVETAIDLLYRKAVPEYRADRAARRITPQWLRPMLEPTSATADVFGRIHRAYIECAKDRAVTLQLQRAMQARFPCDPVFTLDADHAPTFSAGYELADAIVASAAEFERRGPVFHPNPWDHRPKEPDELVI